jgi:glycosyltransferase involved in cell wall biosynthesis
MESTALRDAGFRVSVVSPCPEDELDNPDQVIDGISVYRYPPPPATEGKMSFVKEFIYCYRKTKQLVARIWKENPIDVIQSCNPPDKFWHFARKYQKRHGVKFVFDHHDLCPELYEAKFGRRDAFHRGLLWLERQQFQHADHVISTNESYREIAYQRGGKSESEVTIVRSGPKLDRFRAVEPQPELKKGRQHLGVYVGVMGNQDGVDYALRAVRSAIDQGLDNCHFAFMGSGDAYPSLLELAAELKIEDYVTFTGRVGDDVILPYFSTADFGIAPDPANSFNSACTMNKVIEYMALVLPVVSFDLVESRKSAGEAAVYIPNNDVDLMAKEFRDLLADPERRARMGQIGADRVRNGLSWETSAENYVGLYRNLTR